MTGVDCDHTRQVPRLPASTDTIRNIQTVYHLRGNPIEKWQHPPWQLSRPMIFNYSSNLVVLMPLNSSKVRYILCGRVGVEHPVPTSRGIMCPAVTIIFSSRNLLMTTLRARPELRRWCWLPIRTRLRDFQFWIGGKCEE